MSLNYFCIFSSNLYFQLHMYIMLFVTLDNKENIVVNTCN